MPAGPSHLSVSTRSLLSGSFRFLKKQSEGGFSAGAFLQLFRPSQAQQRRGAGSPKWEGHLSPGSSPWSLPFSMHQLCALGGVGMWGRPSSGPWGHTGPLSEGSRDQEPILYFCTFCFYFRKNDALGLVPGT